MMTLALIIMASVIVAVVPFRFSEKCREACG